jgi:hypothetical protein
MAPSKFFIRVRIVDPSACDICLGRFVESAMTGKVALCQHHRNLVKEVNEERNARRPGGY